MALLTVSGLTLGYGGRPVLSDINFTVGAGDYLCIIGENGSGKSTLMKAVLGLVRPIDGIITFGDGLKKTEIGYLPQQTAAQKDFPASVSEVVLSGCVARGGGSLFAGGEEKKTAAANMEKLGILPLAKKCYRELSGGQQQRVLLARALCAADKLLLLDEPVTGLDAQSTAEMYSVIAELNRNGMAIVMISHDIAAALKYAGIILHVDEPLFFGTSDDFLSVSARRLSTAGREVRE